MIRKNEKIHGRKLQKLILTIHVDYYLTDSDESLPLKGLKFAIPPEKIEYSKFLLPFELLFCDIKYNSESAVFLATLKALLQDAAFNDFSA